MQSKKLCAAFLTVGVIWIPWLILCIIFMCGTSILHYFSAGAANTLRNGWCSCRKIFGKWLFLFDQLISWWCGLVEKVVEGSYRDLECCKTFITLKKVVKTLLFSLKKTFKWHQFKATKTFGIINWNVGHLLAVVFCSSALLTCSLTSVVTMLNECQNNERGLSHKRLPRGSAEPDAISLKFLQCPNENEPKIRFMKAEWYSGRLLHRNQMLESFTGVLFFILISPGGILFLRLDWASQNKLGKLSIAAEI